MYTNERVQEMIENDIRPEDKKQFKEDYNF